jgi:hypothetical protein
MTDEQIGAREFADGATREVYLDPNGRQYVLDDGCKVYGVWLPPAEESAIVVAVPPGGDAS